jgi:hypothetical protein
MDNKSSSIEHARAQLQEFGIPNLQDVCERIYLDHGDGVMHLHPATLLHHAHTLCMAPLGGMMGDGDLTWRISSGGDSPMLIVDLAYDNEAARFVTAVPLTEERVQRHFYNDQTGDSAVVLEYVAEQLDEEDRAELWQDLVQDLCHFQRSIDAAERMKSYSRLPSLLRSAVDEGDANAVKAALILGAPVNAQDLSGNTALHHAAAYGRSGFIAPLIQCGAWVDEPNQMGQTPLHLAVRNKHPLTCLALLAQNADPSRADLLGQPAMPTDTHGHEQRL